MRKKLSIFIILATIVCNCMRANEPSALEQLINHDLTKNASISLIVKNMKTGEVISSYHEKNVLPPASTMKLISTATALEALGSDFRFETYLETDGEIRNGILYGNLFIRGTGDPTLGSQKVGNTMFLYKWVQALRKAGIQEIRGSIIGDNSFFDATATNPAWLWEDIGNYYAPGIFALSYLDNTMNIQLRSAEVGSVAEIIKTLPEVPGISFDNHIRCTKIQYDGAYVHGMPYHNFRSLVGSVPSNRGVFGVKSDIPNPALLLAQHLTNCLKEQGINVTKEAGFQVEPQVDADGVRIERKVIYTHRSEPLSEIVKETNENSNNMYAEMIFRYLGSKVSTPATIDNSIDFVKRFWANRKIKFDGCWIYDGCGLAPQDAVSADAFLQLIEYMNGSKNRDAFFASLPVSGETGTLKGFCVKTPLQGKVHAKSGTLSRVKSYAGYIDINENESWAFAIIVNNANCKVRTAQTLIERFLVGLYEEHCSHSENE